MTPLLELQVLLAWFNESTRPDYTVRDLIDEMKTWFTEGYLYDDVWEALRERVEQEVLPSDAEVRNLITKRRSKRMASLRHAVRHPVTWAVLVVLVAITLSWGELH